jgi:hypothetical protein
MHFLNAKNSLISLDDGYDLLEPINIFSKDDVLA